MPILLSQLLQQIETKQDSNTLTADQATECYKSFILNSINTKQYSHLKTLPLSQITLIVNGKEETIENDINLVIRPRHAHLKTDFPKLSGNELLSAITTNTFEGTPFAEGGMTELVRSTKQYHYNDETNQFESKEKNKKVLRRPKPRVQPTEKPSEEQQNVIIKMLGKDKNRGLYWLDNGLSLLPFIFGISLDRFIGSKQHQKLLAKNPAELKKRAVMLFIQLASLHERGFAHQDMKPANIMYGNDGNITIVDYDFLRPLTEVLPGAMGTLEFIPFDIMQEIQSSKKVHTYQDIYGLLITISLLMDPNIKRQFDFLTDELLKHWHIDKKGFQTLRADMNKLENFITNMAEQHSSPWFKDVIYKALKNRTTSALQITSNLLATDKEMMSYFAELLVKNNPEYLTELNAHINLYYNKYPQVLENLRQQLANYIAECLSGKTVYSPEELINRFDCANETEQNLDSQMINSLSALSDDELKNNLQYVVNFINLSIISNDKLDLLKERMAMILLDGLEERPISIGTIHVIACFLTKGNQTQVGELKKLYLEQENIANFPGRPDLRAGYDAIIHTLVTGLKGIKSYNHIDAMQEIANKIQAAKPKKSSYAERRKSRVHQPSASMFSAGAGQGHFFPAVPVNQVVPQSVQQSTASTTPASPSRS